MRKGPPAAIVQQLSWNSFWSAALCWFKTLMRIYIFQYLFAVEVPSYCCHCIRLFLHVLYTASVQWFSPSSPLDLPPPPSFCPLLPRLHQCPVFLPYTTALWTPRPLPPPPHLKHFLPGCERSPSFHFQAVIRFFSNICSLWPSGTILWCLWYCIYEYLVLAFFFFLLRCFLLSSFSLPPLSWFL